MVKIDFGIGSAYVFLLQRCRYIEPLVYRIYIALNKPFLNTLSLTRLIRLSLVPEQ
jgi:hypothetical protein